MDIISHGLYGGIAFGRGSKRDYLLAFLFGIAPDLLSFGVFFVLAAFGIGGGLPHRDWQGPPAASDIPAYVTTLYHYTHSLVIFAFVFLLVWVARGKPWKALGAWGLHILVDIPTHSSAFFPTPFLWPLSPLTVSGVSWGTWWIFIPNWLLIATLYGVWWHRRCRQGPAAHRSDGYPPPL